MWRFTFLAILIQLCFCKGTESECYTFYDGTLVAGSDCPWQCPFRTQCNNDPYRFSCTASEDCKYLLPKADLVNLTWNINGTFVMSAQACVPCTINGCIDCKDGGNGKVLCQTCNPNFYLNDQGTCTWKSTLFDPAVYLFLTVIILLVVWIISDFVRAECAPVTNRKALERGLVMRRRAQLFGFVDDDGKIRGLTSRRTMMGEAGGGPRFRRYPLNVGLHWNGSSKIMGPGLTLFMNWFPFMGLLGVWFCVGTALYSPSYKQSNSYLDPCWQQERVKTGWKFRSESPLPEGRNGQDLSWAAWNYVGATLITAIFLYGQQRLWSKMVQETTEPSLCEYCVVLSGLPPQETDKDKIVQHLGDWMERIKLNRSGIQHISIAYDIPAKKRNRVEELIEWHLAHACMRFAGMPNSPLAGEQELGPPPKFLFWIRLLSMLFHQTPFRVRSDRVSPEAEEEMKEDPKELLKSLRGSGYVFVVMETEALAHAIVGMGCLNMPGLSEKPIRARKAPAEPSMIHWFNYGHVPLAMRLFRWVRMPVILFLTWNVWLMLFAGFCNFELITQGYTGPSKGIAGFFVGLLIPIGNALFGLVVDLLTENFGFRDGDTVHLWRHILIVLCNQLSSVGEMYLVYKKVYNQERWVAVDFLQHLRDNFVPLGVSPSAQSFQIAFEALLFPAGMLVPLITIPLLKDVLPFLMARWRLKNDTSLTAADAERILRPNRVDMMDGFTDFIINFFIITFASWFSPGSYLITLWLTFCAWILVLYMNMRMNILRWQARTYFGGKAPHMVESYLLAVPLGFLCAALDHERNPSVNSGLLGLSLHMVGQFIFLKYVLTTLEPPKQSFGTLLGEMMEHENAPVATYNNTNPIEVLRREHMPESEPDPTPLIFYRDDKWYLQGAGMNDSDGFQRNRSVNLFADEHYAEARAEGLFSAAKVEAFHLAQDIIHVGADTGRGAVETARAVGQARPSRLGSVAVIGRISEGRAVPNGTSRAVAAK